MNDKLNSAKGMLAGYTGIPKVSDTGFASAVSSQFGSSTAGQSPLDKLVSRTNNG